MQPFVKWAGGKSALLPEIRKRMPTNFGCYYEPFLGGGAVFFGVRPKEAILSDANFELVNAYCRVRDDVGGVIKILQNHIDTEEHFYTVRDADRTDALDRMTKNERAARFIYLNKTCFNGLWRVNKKGQMNTSYGKGLHSHFCDTLTLKAASIALRQAKVLCLDYESIFGLVHQGDFVYLDPPYVPVSRTANFTGYTAQGFDEKEQQRLRKFCGDLHDLGVRFLLSNVYHCSILDLYGEFTIEAVSAPRKISGRGSSAQTANEVLISNY